MNFPKALIFLSVVLAAGLFLTGPVLAFSSENEYLHIDEHRALTIVINDPVFQDLLRHDGNVVGIVVSCPSQLQEQTGYICLPAVSVESPEKVTDFVIDPVNESVVRIVTMKNWDSWNQKIKIIFPFPYGKSLNIFTINFLRL